MNSKHKLSDLTTGHRRGTDGGAMIGPEVRVIGVSRRIWIILGVMALLVVGLALAYFRAQGALDTTSETLKTAIESAKMAEIALKHETEAKEQAIADREQLVKELSAQGDRLAEFSRGEEQAKTKANQASTGVEEAEKRIAALKAKLKTAEKDITALAAELEVKRAELDQARADVEIWRARAEPYGQPGTPAPQPQ